MKHHHPTKRLHRKRRLKQFLAVLIILVSTCFLAAAVVGLALKSQLTDTTRPLPTSTPRASTTSATQSTTNTTPTTLSNPTVPDSAKIEVAFASQAPLGIWDALHEDACEEASLLMVYHYLNKTPLGTPSEFDKEIKDMVVWEEARGYGLSITLEQLNTIAREYLGMNNGTIITLNSLAPLRQEIANNNPPILGMAGKILPNPNFKDGGPIYHMLVATGYTSDKIITNDPGTRLGHNFAYANSAFYTAIHDWDPAEILNGQKAMLVFK